MSLELKPTDHSQRRLFVELIIEQQKLDAGFSSKIIFSDKAHFHFDGFENQQKCRIWRLENLTCHCVVWILNWTHYQTILFQTVTDNGGHLSRRAIQPEKQLLHESLSGRVVFHYGDQNRSSGSCDFVDCRKSKVYVNNSTTTNAFKEEIMQCINEVAVVLK